MLPQCTSCTPYRYFGGHVGPLSVHCFKNGFPTLPECTPKCPLVAAGVSFGFSWLGTFELMCSVYTRIYARHTLTPPELKLAVGRRPCPLRGVGRRSSLCSLRVASDPFRCATALLGTHPWPPGVVCAVRALLLAPHGYVPQWRERNAVPPRFAISC